MEYSLKYTCADALFGPSSFQVDLLGQNILNYTHPDDIESLKNNLMPQGIPMGPNGKLVMPGSIVSRKDRMLRNERRTFHIR
jgi:hypothetical protein